MADILTWATEDGLAEFMRQFDLDYSTAAQYRARYSVAALQGLTAALQRLF